MKINLPDNYKYSIHGNNLLIETSIFNNRFKSVMSIFLDCMSGILQEDLQPPIVIEIFNIPCDETVEVKIDKNMNISVSPKYAYEISTRDYELISWRFGFLSLILFSIIVGIFVSLIILSASFTGKLWVLVLLLPIWVIVVGLIRKYFKLTRIVRSIL
ncbi:hypothetical protein AOC36_07920 [Erysipelothrix larvae]|uniref:Uncharacterized protein n=1 Tax=Erysipelothrix larvae TaxID=1514105 RepID=A0A109UH91_9FIRM|nr:hypothetical protein [Erysipelothrix larvae]AMC93913.1 hypothetical protein AOC36_07920 [Erysipelothrix larvae]